MNSTLRKHALSIFQAALKAADPKEAILRHLNLRHSTRGEELLVAGRHRYSLDRFRSIYLVGAGKAGAPMAQAIERLLGTRVRGGFVNVKYGHTAKLKRTVLNQCGHPVPDSNGVVGAKQIEKIASQCGKDDLLICLISGGASALLPAPAPPVTLEQKQETTKLLLNSGANIQEINVVRKHISRLKGGQLANIAYPATVLTLLLSDVIGDDLDAIGSGPTTPDRSTFSAAEAILRKFGIYGKTPSAVRERIRQGVAGTIEETPKAGSAVFRHVNNLIVGSNKLAVNAAADRARSLGFHTMVLSTFIAGETRDVAQVHAAIAREIAASGRPLKRPACVISGGETTVTVRGSGIGGRNQEFALAAAIEIAGLRDVVIFSAGTDGTDGPTDAAGAFADGGTLQRAERASLSPAQYLADNDAYRFFDSLGDLFKTGPTQTNVMDVRLVLVGNPR